MELSIADLGRAIGPVQPAWRITVCVPRREALDASTREALWAINPTYQVRPATGRAEARRTQNRRRHANIVRRHSNVTVPLIPWPHHASPGSGVRCPWGS
jgi:hypothetical protein